MHLIGLKASAVIRRFNHNDSLVETSMNAVNWTFTYHGSPSGSILGDEIERDLAPYSGSELCTAVETGYSLAYLYQTLGTNALADRAELVIYNAMPVMLTGDMWARQYMDQPNQPWATNNTEDFTAGPYVFTTANSGVATTFGMEPLYPCCTVNHPQGYPKFVANSWAAVNTTGLAHALLGPSKVTTAMATIECDTNYPFGSILNYSVTAAQAFDLYLRVPEWADLTNSSVATGTATPATLQPDPTTGMHKLSLPSGASTVQYTLDASVRTVARANNTLAFYVGNMLYALDVGQTNTSSLPHAYYDPTGPGIAGLPFPQLRDYYVSNTTAWNVAVDPSTVAYSGPADAATLPTPVFVYGAPPNSIAIDGCEIAWELYLNATPGLVPADRTCTGPRSTYKLVPYGAAKVHMSELPTVSFS